MNHKSWSTISRKHHNLSPCLNNATERKKDQTHIQKKERKNKRKKERRKKEERMKESFA